MIMLLDIMMIMMLMYGDHDHDHDELIIIDVVSPPKHPGSHGNMATCQCRTATTLDCFRHLESTMVLRQVVGNVLPVELFRFFSQRKYIASQCS